MNNKKLIILSLISFYLITSHTYSKSLPYKQGQISQTIGKTQSKRKISLFRKITKGQLIREGETIQTHSNGLLEIILFNNKKLRIYNDTLILIEKIEEAYISIFLVKGSISINEKASKGFSYKIKGTFFRLETIEKSHLYIENRGDKVNFTLKDGTIKLSQNKEDKIINIKSPTLLSFNKKDTTDNIKTRSTEYSKTKSNIDKITEYSKKEDAIFDESSPIGEYDPFFTSKITKDDLFFKEIEKIQDRKNLIRTYRKRKLFSILIDTTPFNWLSNNFYFSLGLYPKIDISNFVLSFRFSLFMPYTNTLQIEEYYNINEWKFSKLRDYFNKIDYIEYINKKKTFYIRIAEIKEQSRAYKLIVNNYDNTIFSPKERYLGLAFGLNFPTVDIEGFITDISKFNLMSFRIATRPFIDQDKDKFNDYYTFGVNYSADLAPSNIDSNPEIHLLSFDIGIPLLRRKASSYKLKLYTEIAIQGYQFTDEATANRYNKRLDTLKFTDNFGITIGMSGILFRRLVYNLNYNYLQKGFIPHYMDIFYEIQRENNMNLLLSENKEDAHGFLIGLGINYPKYIYLYSTFYYETGEIANLNKVNNKFTLEIKTSSYLSPIFTGKLIYTYENINSFIDFFERIIDNSFLYFEVKAAITKYLDIRLGYKHFIEDKHNKQFTNFVFLNFLFIL